MITKDEHNLLMKNGVIALSKYTKLDQNKVNVNAENMLSVMYSVIKKKKKTLDIILTNTHFTRF